MVAQIVLIMLWIVIIITGKRPEGLAKLLVYYLRWSTRYTHTFPCSPTNTRPSAVTSQPRQPSARRLLPRRRDADNGWLMSPVAPPPSMCVP